MNSAKERASQNVVNVNLHTHAASNELKHTSLHALRNWLDFSITVR